MAYAVEADLNLSDTRLIELTDSEDAVGVKDDALLTLLEAESAAIVDALLGGVVTVPFSPVPAVIKLITAWIWRYRIYLHRPEMEIPKAVLDDYTRAMEWLQLMATGAMPIVPESADSAEVTAAFDVESSCSRGWTRRYGTTV